MSTEPTEHFSSEHISDFAVHTGNPRLLAASNVTGAVHTYEATEVRQTWATTIANARVCWANESLLVWGAQKQLAVLSPTGGVSTFEIVEHADVAFAGTRVWVAQRSSLLSYQLRDGRALHKERVKTLDNYVHGTLTSSTLGAIAFVDGRQLHFQNKPDADWQILENSCHRIAFARDGSKLAVVQARGAGTLLSVIDVKNGVSLDVDRHVPAVPVLASTVIQLDWSLDGRFVLLVGGDGEMEVRDTRTLQLSFSANVPGFCRFYASDDLIVSGSPRGLEAFRWKPVNSKLWILPRSGSKALDDLELVDSRGMSRGDEVLLFTDTPSLRPAALYEITQGAHTFEPDEPGIPTRGAATVRLRLPEPGADKLDANRDVVTRLAAASPATDAEMLGLYTDAINLLHALYDPESPTGSQLPLVLDVTTTATNKSSVTVHDSSEAPIGSTADVGPGAEPQALADPSSDAEPSPTKGLRILTDREAADIRASKAVGTAHSSLALLLNANAADRQMKLRNGLREAVHALSEKLVHIYSRLQSATQQDTRDELVAVIKDRLTAFIKSAHATYGQGTAGAARMAMNLIASATMGIPAELDLAIYDAHNQRRTPPLPESTSLPEKIGPWIVQERIGGGGQADAYLVIHSNDPSETKRVLKLLKPWTPQGKASSEHAQRVRFSREVEALVSLGAAGCPDIVAVIDQQLMPTEGQPWYVMPYYAGPLEKRFRDFTGNIDRVLEVVETLATTLAWMHDHKPLYVHRDVHAGNVFFDVETDRAKLGDFGLVVVEDPNSGPLISTAVEEFGPWQWRPPELHKGSPDLHNPLSDVYLLGGVIYGALTGGEHLVQTEQGGIFAHEKPELSIVRFSSDARVPHVNKLLRYMLAREPKQRIRAHRVAELCRKIRAWRPSAPPPINIPADERLALAAARVRARSGAPEREAKIQELIELCARARETLPLSSDDRPNFTVHLSASVEGNQDPRQLNDNRVLSLRVLLRLGVSFGPEPKIALDSYIELGSLDMSWMISVLRPNEPDFEPVRSLLEGDVEVERVLAETAKAEFQDLKRRLAEILDGD